MSRQRVLRPGWTVIEGRAWSGWAPVTAVEVSVDGGSWVPAQLEPAPDRWSWVRWTWPWGATAGRHQLSARAHHDGGRSQPVEQPWNRGGFANNVIQHVTVVVPE